MMTDIAQHIAAAHGFLPKGVSQEESEACLAAQSQTVHDRELPGLTIEFSNNVSELQNLLQECRNAGPQLFLRIAAAETRRCRW